MRLPVLLAVLVVAGCKGKSATGAESSSRATGGAGSASASYGSKRPDASNADAAVGSNDGAPAAAGSNAAASGAVTLADAGPGWAGSLSLVRGKAHATSVAIDSANNAVIAVEFEHAITVGNQTFEGGEGGMLLLKVPIAGGPIAWTKLLGKGRTLESTSIAVDSRDAIVLTGALVGTIDVGGGALTSAGDKDILLAKFGPDGTHQWSHRFGGREPDRPANVAIDAKDNIAIAGYYADAADFGGKKLTGKNSAEMFVAKYTPAGKVVFANRISGGGENQSELFDVTVDARSNVIAIGAFYNKLDLGGKPLAGIAGKTLQTFVVAYTPAGGIAWSTAYAPGSMTMGNVVRADAAGNVIIAGNDMNMPIDQNNMVSFDFKSGAPTQGAMKSFVAKLGPDHKRKWSVAIANLGMGDLVEPAIAANGDILVVGDSASAPFDLPELKNVKTFFARLSPEGAFISVAPFSNATERTASPKLAIRGTTVVIAVQTDEGSGPGLTLFRPE
jgi:hypothetical protein